MHLKVKNLSNEIEIYLITYICYINTDKSWRFLSSIWFYIKGDIPFYINQEIRTLLSYKYKY